MTPVSAPGKFALLPGRVMSFDNVTSYDRGINGVMVDVGNLGGAASAAVFGVRVGDAPLPGGGRRSRRRCRSRCARAPGRAGRTG